MMTPVGRTRDTVLTRVYVELSRDTVVTAGYQRCHYKLLYQSMVPVVTPRKTLMTLGHTFNKNKKMSYFKRNENIHKKEDGSYYVVSANKTSSVTL